SRLELQGRDGTSRLAITQMIWSYYIQTRTISSTQHKKQQHTYRIWDSRSNLRSADCFLPRSSTIQAGYVMQKIWK
ncbi:MAG: hypothetical protein EZS28_033953, partial [Streblomastix strix]